MKRCKLEDRKRTVDEVNGYFKVAAILIFIFVLLLAYTNVKADNPSSLSGDLDVKGIASDPFFSGGISAITDRIGKLIAVLFNAFVFLSVGAAGYGFVQLTMGHIKQDPSAINHARSLIAFSFISLVGIAVVPKLAWVMLTAFNNGKPNSSMLNLFNIFGGR
jgi:TRAP-type mannitol/chloroaromatic compound transport system permease small subunit